MYNSPTTPTGTGRNPVSNTYACVLAIGRPIDGLRAARSSTVATVDQIVVSVGPYRFVTEAAHSTNEAAKSAGKASPPTNTRTPASSEAASAATARHKLGVACITDTPADTTVWRSANGSAAASRPATTTAAPLISGTKTSRFAMSNPTVVTANSRSPALRRNRSCIASRKFTNPPDGTT